MKKLSLEMLKLTSEEVLERSQMKNITGDGYWHCRCSPSSSPFTVMANDDMEAAQVGAAQCGPWVHCTEVQQ